MDSAPVLSRLVDRDRITCGASRPRAPTGRVAFGAQVVVFTKSLISFLPFSRALTQITMFSSFSYPSNVNSGGSQDARHGFPHSHSHPAHQGSFSVAGMSNSAAACISSDRQNLRCQLAWVRLPSWRELITIKEPLPTGVPNGERATVLLAANSVHSGALSYCVVRRTK